MNFNSSPLPLPRSIVWTIGIVLLVWLAIELAAASIFGNLPVRRLILEWRFCVAVKTPTACCTSFCLSLADIAVLVMSVLAQFRFFG